MKRITPEMIAAGVSELLDYDDDYEFREDAVVRIFTAMVLAGLTAQSVRERNRARQAKWRAANAETNRERVAAAYAAKKAAEGNHG